MSKHYIVETASGEYYTDSDKIYAYLLENNYNILDGVTQEELGGDWVDGFPLAVVSETDERPEGLVFWRFENS